MTPDDRHFWDVDNDKETTHTPVILHGTTTEADHDLGPGTWVVCNVCGLELSGIPQEDLEKATTQFLGWTQGPTAAHVKKFVPKGRDYFGIFGPADTVPEGVFMDNTLKEQSR